MGQGAEIDDIASLRQAVLDGSSSAAMDLALLLKKQGDLQGMLAAFEDADRLGSVDGSGSLGTEYARLDRLEEAELAYDRCIERGGGERAIAERTLIRIRRERVDPREVETFVSYWCAATDLVPDVVGHLTPDQVAALTLCAGVEQHVDLDRLLDSHRDAFLAGVEVADRSGGAHGAFLSGLLCEQAGNVGEAAVAFRRAAERGKTTAWVSAARAFARLGDVDGALEAARAGKEAGVEGATEALIELQSPSGDEPSPAELLAEAHRLYESGNLTDAAELYRKTIAGGDPSAVPSAHLHLALICDSGGDIVGATQHYLEAARSGDADAAPLGHFNHAKILERSGRIDEAIAQYIEIAETTRHTWAAPWAAHDAAVLLMKERHDVQGGLPWLRNANKLAIDLGNEDVATQTREMLDAFDLR